MPSTLATHQRPTLRAVLVLLPILLSSNAPVAGTAPVTEAPTIGFADRTDLGALLGYRLPDWGWRTWEADGHFHGGGSREAEPWAGQYHRLIYDSALATTLNWHRESEARTWSLAAVLDGGWHKDRYSWSNGLIRQNELSGSYDVQIGLDRYLTDRPWFVGIMAGAGGTYLDRLGSSNEARLIRTHENRAQLDLGWGRLRDVTPLVRAQRLAERLVTLGRPRPEAAQVQAAARILAQFGGYQLAYERPEHRFWEKVLAPLIGEEPLSVAEIYYLRDVFVEDLGIRRQGLRAALSGLWHQGGLGDRANYRPGVMATVETSRNLALDLQMAMRVSTILDWQRPPDDAQDRRVLTATTQFALLWNVVDRTRMDWVISASYIDLDAVTFSRVSRAVSSQWSWRVYIEDRTSIRPFVNLSWNEREDQSDQFSPQASRAWVWSYGISLHYRLDGVLF
jgi:hypothetical protein